MARTSLSPLLRAPFLPLALGAGVVVLMFSQRRSRSAPGTVVVPPVGTPPVGTPPVGTPPSEPEPPAAPLPVPPPMLPPEEPTGPTPGSTRPPVEIETRPPPFVSPVVDVRPRPSGVDVFAPPPPPPPPPPGPRLARTVARPGSRFVRMWAEINNPDSRAKADIPRGIVVETYQTGREAIGQRGPVGERRQLGDYVYIIFRSDGGPVQGWIPIEEIVFYDPVATGQVFFPQRTRAAELSPLPYRTALPGVVLQAPRVDGTPRRDLDLQRPYVSPPTTRTFARVKSPGYPVIMHARLDPKVRASARIPQGAVVETFGEPRWGVVASELQNFPRNHPEGWAGLYTRSIYVAPDGGINDGWIRSELLRPLERTELTPQGFPLDPSTYRPDL